MAKIIHYRNKCIGCGICYELQPALWRMSRRDGKATLLKATAKKEVYILGVSGADLQRVMEISHSCPVKIIKVC